ncbi:Fructosamine-3-kinase [Halopelagius inordinatus]|uniref:Fructosamine-3-kinase n=1 Tax=Halopelagius inordinatus TaxID=553467 RepID=A0A1I2NEK2_9EURY|nr:fructosamine kinase family protein [Halopelagius inordinatus]SFG02013.1 Fructosamine-3-kinase [Halopelagius inordinatus]
MAADDASETPPPEEIRSRVEPLFDAPVTDLTELDGGFVGTVYRLSVAGRDPVVAKVGATPLTVEAEMLRYLAAESSLPVPEVFHAEDDLLVMAYVEGDDDPTFGPELQRAVADHLAALHDVTAEAFGFPRDTLSGPYRQPNPWTDSWVEFYRDHRLRHCADEAVAEGSLPASYRRRIEAFAEEIDAVLSEPAAPALVHGDVWEANLVVSGDDVRAFLDPALYYGHPEVELAYVAGTEAFEDPFFDRYRERRGIDAGFFEKRRPAYRLYPVLEHVRVFGDRYLSDLDETLSRLGY